MVNLSQMFLEPHAVSGDNSVMGTLSQTFLEPNLVPNPTQQLSSLAVDSITPGLLYISGTANDVVEDWE